MPQQPHPFIQNEMDELCKKKELRDLFNSSLSPRLMPSSMGPVEPEPRKLEPFQKKDAKIKELTKRVEALERLINITFNGHVLINGQFVKITP